MPEGIKINPLTGLPHFMAAPWDGGPSAQAPVEDRGESQLVGSGSLVSCADTGLLQTLAGEYEAATGLAPQEYNQAPDTPEAKAEGLARDLEYYRRSTEEVHTKLSRRFRLLRS